MMQSDGNSFIKTSRDKDNIVDQICSEYDHDDESGTRSVTKVFSKLIRRVS